jgi:hypothetical protein
VLPAGIGQAPARQAALAAGIPDSVGCTTVNKVCGSGMKAVMFGHDLLRAGSGKIVVAGGMESMSNAPYLLPKARAGYRMGHQQVLDHMFYDGLQNPYDGNMMGHFAELTAEKYGFTREAQDEFSIESVRRALAAVDGAFEGDRPGDRQDPARRAGREPRRGARPLRDRQDPEHAAGLQQGRHGHRRLLLVDLRRRRRAGADDRGRGRPARPRAAGAHRRPRRLRARARVVHDRARFPP